MHCQGCGLENGVHRIECSGCGSLLEGGSLARGDDALDRALDAQLARLTLHGLLEREALASGIVLDAELATPLALSELEGTVERLMGADAPTLNELEAALAPGGTDAMLEGVRLMDFLDEATVRLDILRKGFVFLRRQRHGLALEWWALNRQQLRADEGRLELLLLLLECYTYRLSGDTQRAMRTLERVRAHPLFPSRTPLSRRRDS